VTDTAAEIGDRQATILGSGVRFAYHHRDSRLDILSGVDCELVGPGMYSIVGASGAGKTTLLYILSGLVVADAGKVVVADVALADASPRIRAALRRRTLAVSFQPPTLFRRFSASSNLRMASIASGAGTALARENAHKTLGRLGLMARAKHPMRRLSQGEQQRVNLGAAVVRDTPILLLDEPTKSLDGDMIAIVIQMLLHRAKKSLVICATHEERVVDASDHVLTLEGGLLSPSR